MQVVKGGDALQQAILLFTLQSELAGYEGIVPQGKPEHREMRGRSQSPTQTSSEYFGIDCLRGR